MAINTLSVATQGFIPNRTPISVNTLGWLGGVAGPVFVTGNDLIWNLFTRQLEWSEPRSNVTWSTTKSHTRWNVPAKGSDTTWRLNEE